MARQPTKFSPAIRASAPAQRFERVAIKPPRPTLDSALGERGAAAANVGRAVSNFGNSIGDLFGALQARQDDDERFDAQADFIRLQTELDRDLVELRRAAPLGAPDHSAVATDLVQSRYSQYLESIENPELRQQMELRVLNDTRSRLPTEFAFELEASDDFILDTLNEQANVVFGQVFDDPNSYEAQFERFDSLIEASNLTEQEKDDLRRQTRAQMADYAYQGLIETDPNAIYQLGVDPSGQVGGIITDPAGNPNPQNFVELQPHVQDATRSLSAAFGQPLQITPHGGANTRASSGSQHPHGTATDLLIADYTDAQRQRLVALAIANGANGIGTYGPGSQGFNTLHVDYRTTGGNNFQDVVDGGIALWWRPAAGDDRGWNDSTAPLWFQNGVRQGIEMRRQTGNNGLPNGDGQIDFSGRANFENGVIPRSFLDFIAEAEGTGGNYNAYFGNADNQSVMLTNMTLDEVIEWQSQLGGPSTAAGRYQFIQGTLRGLKNVLGLTGEEIFNPALQDRLALYLVQEDYQGSDGSIESFGHNLAATWASFPDPATGRSYYDGDGLNASRVTTAQLFAAMGSEGPPITDPRFQHIPIERRLTLARAGQARRQEIDAQESTRRQAEYDAGLNQRLHQARDGTYTVANLSNDLASGWLTDFNDRVRLENEIDRRQDGVQAATRFVSNLSSTQGNYVFTQTDVGDANEWFEITGGRAQLMAGGDEATAFVQNQLIPAYQRSGIMPEEAVNILSQMLTVPNMQTQQFAARALDTMLRSGPANPIQSVDQNTARMVRWWRSASQFTEEQTIFGNLSGTTDPNQSTRRAQLESEARELVGEVSMEQIYGDIANGLLRRAPESAPFGDNGLLREDYETAFTLAYRRGHINADQAHDIAMQEINQLWGEWNGNLMKYPPDRHYPPSFDGSRDWILEQARTELEIPAEAPVFLLSDAESRNEVDRRESPAYQVMYVDPELGPMPVLDAGGRHIRWAPELPTELTPGYQLDVVGPRSRAYANPNARPEEAAPELPVWEPDPDWFERDPLPFGEDILQRLTNGEVNPGADTRRRRQP